MTIIVFGGTGFIGQHTLEHFEKRGAKTLTVSQSDKTGDLKADIRKPIRLKGDFSAVLHLAGKKNLKTGESQTAFFDTNMHGTLNVLEFCRKKDVRKIVFASTCAVYGKRLSGVITETSPLHTTSYYGLSKIGAENLVIEHSHMYGLEYSILRYSTVFGPLQPRQSIVSKIINGCKNNRNFLFDRESHMNLVYVGDVARANYLALKSKQSGVFNVAGEENVSIKQLATYTKKILKSKSKVEAKKKRRNRFQIYVSKTKKELGFSPNYSWKTGLLETIRLKKKHQ